MPNVTSADASNAVLPTAQRTLSTREGALPSTPLLTVAAVVPVMAQTQRVWRPGWQHAVALLLSALLLSAVAAGPNTLSVDLRITHAVQALDNPLAAGVAALGNALGSTVGIVLAGLTLGAVLLASRRWTDVAFVIAALLLTRGNWLLKHAFSSPRPSATQVEVRDPASFYGFPSGHTSATVLLVGVALVLLWPHLHGVATRRLATALGGAVVLGVGFARVYSGAHWPSDVLGGVLWGVLGVWALVALRRVVERRWRAQRASAPTTTSTAARITQAT